MAYISPPVQLALLDDHKLFRQGMRHILLTLPFVESVLETGSFAELQGWCRQRRPDVLLLDLQMPGIDGIEATQRLLAEFPDLKIIVVSMFSAEKYLTQMLKLGVRSYLPKEVGYEQLVQALNDILTTGYHYTAAMEQAVQGGRRYHAARPAPVRLNEQVHFTLRELDVLRLLGQGLPTADIAERLFLGRRTVEGYRQRLLEKTETTNAAGLVAYAARHGLLEA